MTNLSNKQGDKSMEALNTDTIIIDTIISAPVAKVWEAWTDPVVILNWFGSDPNGKGINAKLDPRPAGYFEISFEDADGTEHTCSGIYSDVLPPRKLSFSWTWKAEPGVESFVIVELTPENGFTRMLFRHENVGTASKHQYFDGWQRTFQKLERLLTRP